MTIDPADIERFRVQVLDRLGLFFDEGRFETLSDTLKARMEALGLGSAAAYLERLSWPSGSRDEWGRIAEKLTVTETYFFRYAEHFSAFSEVVLPALELKQRHLGQREFRILSAACASGEEPYSLAILVKEWLARQPQAPLVKILAIDVNPAALAKAAKGLYSSWSLRDTPSEIQQRYFKPEGRDFKLDDSIRAMVSFEERNLLDSDSDFWRPQAFDTAFFRNACMYFPAETSRRVIAKIAASLRGGAHLFLGHAETLRGLSEAFHLRQSHGVFYYQLRDGARPESPLAGPAPDSPAKIFPGGLTESAATWMEAIQRASDRIQELSEARPAQAAALPEAAASSQPEPPSPAARQDLGLVLERMSREKFGEAMSMLSELPHERQEDFDALMLRAVLLTNAGDSRRAKEACERLLAIDEMNAGAHYLMALCLEADGELAAAAAQDQAAAYLDPGFAMPRLHLGLMAKRATDLPVAQRELAQALDLLAREDPARILLFGGGFNRQGLSGLCRNELRSTEAAR
jgi:chemotaxis protein methyltransferase CheR